MITKLKSLDPVSFLRHDFNNQEYLNKFIDEFNESYNHLYITSNWQDLRSYIRESFVNLESHILSEYFRKAENLLVNNFKSLSTINSSLNVGRYFVSSNPSKDLLYSNIVINLILTSNVKVHNNEYNFGITDLDLFIIKYHIYTTLYLCLVDICIKLYEFDSAVERLIQLGIVQYYLRIEITNIVNRHSYFLKNHDQDYLYIYRRLDQCGIYLSKYSQLESEENVIKSVIEYWKDHTDLELWSRLFKIFLGIDSIYNALNKIESLPLSIRLRIFSSVNFYLSEHSLRFSGFKPKELVDPEDILEYEGVKYPDNDELNLESEFFATRTSLNDLIGRVSRTHIISHVFSSTFSFQCFFIEGVLFISDLCKDFYKELSSFLYSILYDVLQIFLGINCYYRYYKRSQLTNKLVYSCLGLFKLHFRHYNFIPPILQFVYNKHRLEKRLDLISWDSLMPKFIKKTSLLKKFGNPILGFSNVSSLLKSDLEHNFLFHSLNPFNFSNGICEDFTVLPNTTMNNSNVPVEFHLNFANLGLDALKHKWHYKRSYLEKLLINGKEISRFRGSTDSYIQLCFLKMLHNVAFKVKIKNMNSPKISYKNFDLSFRYVNEGNNIIFKYPDNVLCVVISICFLIDDVYSFINYSQSLEYLQYKDTLKTKNRAIVQTLLPFVPKRSTKDAKKILLFQKHIKKRFKSNLMSSKNFIPFIPNLKKTYTSLTKYLFKSEPKPRCDLYLKNAQDLKSKVTFKVSSVKRNERPALSSIKINKFINPLLSSSKATYGQAYNTGDFKNTRSNRRSIYRYNNNLSNFLNSYSSGEIIDNRFLGLGYKCIHLSLGSSFKECDFCKKLNSFQHLSHLMQLIDLLAHYVFTINLSCSTDFKLIFKTKNMSLKPKQVQNVSNNTQNLNLSSARSGCYTSREVEVNESNQELGVKIPDFSIKLDDLTRRSFESSCRSHDMSSRTQDLTGRTNELICEPYDLELLFSEILSQIDKSFYLKSCSFFNKHDLPYKILNEVIENTILLSLSTVFHEDYYKHLVSRLSLYNLIKGRFNICISLMNQTIGQKTTYKIDYGSRYLDQSQNYISDIDEEFKRKVANKIYIELLNDQYTFRELNGIGESCKIGRNSTNNDKLYLMTGASYLKEAPSKYMDSLSIIDANFKEFTCDLFPPPESKCYIPFTLELSTYLSSELQGSGHKSGKEMKLPYLKQSEYRTTMKLATETLLKAVNFDPLDYKCWHYLSRCSLYSGDLHFALKCSERSIECFDSCVASWLTKVLCNSTRIRTCSGFTVNQDTWNEYIKKRSLGNSVSFKSIPSPLESVLPTEIGNLNDLELHFNRFVGDDLECCLLTLKSLRNFDNIYVSSAILLMTSRLDPGFNPLFPWESEYLSDSFMVEKPTLNYNQDPTSIQNTLKTQTTQQFQNTPRDETVQFINYVKKMVTNSVDNKYLICSVPFINLILRVFLNKQSNLKCRHHSDKLYAYNSSGLSLNFLEEELYGWITCIEVLCQFGSSEISAHLLPLLDLYMEFYSIDKYFKRRNDKNVCKISHANRNKRKLVQKYFGQGAITLIDIMLEIRYINFYVKCYNIMKTGNLKELLEEARALNSKYSYRKFALLINRILTGLKDYSQSIQLGNQLHRLNLKMWQYTDFDTEYRSLMAFAHSLKMIGDKRNYEKVDIFAKQLYLTTPILKLDLCLNVPL